MQEQEIKSILEKQRTHFKTGATLPVSARKRQLEKLYNAIVEYKPQLLHALKTDLGKSEFESYMCEIGLTLSEITFMQKHLRKYAKDRRVHTPMVQFHSSCRVSPAPYGQILVMSPWNYPILLTLEPLVDALAAGNTVILKPSAYSAETSRVLEEMIRKTFSPELVAVVTGGREENQALLQQKFDYIFFTGGTTVGREVMRHAAEHLTPMTLEMGGKSPVIVDEHANLKLAARRIVFGKYINCGQTCVAPDYILCSSKVKDTFLQYVKEEIKRQFGEDPLSNPNYGKIINAKHFDRILGLIEDKKVIVGGNAKKETLQIAPTVMDHVTFEDAVMGEEIFGPIMPVIEYEKLDDALDQINARPHPLAFYLFTDSKEIERHVLSRCNFGGGCVNDTIVHLATSEMGFGGVGESGMGQYHGKTGFDTFTHYRSILTKKNWIDVSMRYQPYTDFNNKLLKMFLK